MMKIKQICLVSAAGVLLSACGLMGPNYSEPNLNAPQAWRSPDQISQVESTNLAQLAWWKQFKDAKLNQLIESALSNNNNLQMAMGNVLHAQAALRKVNMGWVPTVALGAGGMTGQAFNPSFTNLSGYPLLNNVNPSTQGFDGYGVGVIPSYTLNVFSQIKQGEIAKLNLALQKQATNAVRLGVISQVAGSYFTLLGLQKQLELQQQILADAREMRHYTQVQYDSGSVSDFNLEALDQYIAGLVGSIPSLKANITQTENALQVLTNNNPGKIITQNTFDQIKPDGIVPVNLPSSVLKQRPDIIAAEYQLQIANGNIGAVTAQFFPTISLTGMLGQGSMQLNNLFSAGGDFWATQLGVGMPLFNLGLYAEIDKAKAGYYSAYYNYIQNVRSAFSQVDDGLSSHDSLNQNAIQQKVALNKAQSLYTIAQKQYQQGTLSYANTLGLKLNIDYAQSNANQVKIQQMNSLVNLYQVLGGGYQVESQLTQIKKFGDGHDI